MRAWVLLSLFVAQLASAQVLVPDDAITPGALDADATPATICDNGTGAVRHTTAHQKAEAYRLYNRIPYQGECSQDKRGCEVDHRVPLTCGGADEQANLWPQPYPQASWKDRIEAHYWRAICTAHRAGDDDAARSLIDQCRAALLGDWRVEYQNRFGTYPGDPQ